MPKIIDNVREEIIKKAQITFFEGNPEALNIRRIAKECNIAMGTVYNYFPSKQELMKEILKIHISGVLNHIKEKVSVKKTKEEKLEQIYLTLRETFVRSDKKIVKSIASMILSYPLDNTEIIALEVKNFGEKFNDLLKEELDISDNITIYIIVNTLMFFAHTPEYTFKEVWEKLDKLL